MNGSAICFHPNNTPIRDQNEPCSESALRCTKGIIETRICILYAYIGLIPSIPEFFLDEKLLMLLRLFNGAAWRKVDSCLKMLIEPI